LQRTPPPNHRANLLNQYWPVHFKSRLKTNARRWS
jgi:hypothetical protein